MYSITSWRFHSWTLRVFSYTIGSDYINIYWKPLGLQVFIIIFDKVQEIDSKFKKRKVRHRLFSDNTQNEIIPLFF